MAINMVERELYDNRSLLDKEGIMHIEDYDLGVMTKDELNKEFIPKLKADPTVAYMWVKGESAVVFRYKEGHDGPKWGDLLTSLSIGINWDGKVEVLPKRNARLFSPRNVVATITNAEFMETLLIIGDSAMATEPRFLLGDPDVEKLLDGMAVVKRSTAVHWCREAGINPRKLRNCEGLSISIVYNGGLVKAFVYIVDDEDWNHPDEYGFVTTDANIKNSMYTIGDVAHVVFDIFHHYGQPKTNGQMDVMLGRMLFTKHATNMVTWLEDELRKHANRIKDGTALKTLQEWHMPSLDREIQSSNKVSEEFAALNDMAADAHARGMDYRWFPTLVDMLRSSVSSMYWSSKRHFPYYPLVCSKAVPVITESGAALMGYEITVDRGTIRSIRNGDVWVVNDEDFVDFIHFNAGGSDHDDHYVLIQRTVNGEKMVLLVRNPMSYREFSLLKFVEGDPVFTYTTSVGDQITFPVMPNPPLMNLRDAVDQGFVRFTGLAESDPVEIVREYTLDSLIPALKDIVEGESGNVGAVVNAVILAAAEDPNLLREMPTTMEGCIDAFTKGGAITVRAQLMGWAKSLIYEVGKRDKVDAAMWDLRAKKRTTPVRAIKEDGFWTQYIQSNITLRTRFNNHINEWNQQQAMEGNRLITKMEELFGVKRAGVPISRDPMIIEGIILMKAFNSMVSDVTKQKGRLMVEDWRSIYNAQLESMKRVAGGSEEKLMLLTLVTWFACMSVPTKFGGVYSDKAVMNTQVWKVFIQALVHFGLAMDLEVAAADIRDNLQGRWNPWTTEWTMACTEPGCTNAGTTREIKRYIDYVWAGNKCRFHR